MRIAIDCRLVSFPAASEQFFGAHMLPHIINNPGKMNWFLITDEAPPPDWITPEDVKIVVVKPRAGSVAAKMLWYDWRLPDILTKYKIDLFIGAAGYISLRSKVPQLLWLHDALDLPIRNVKTGWATGWYRRRLPGMLKNASVIVIPLTAQSPLIEAGAPGIKAKILVSGPGAWPEGKVLSKDEKESVKSQNAEGKEFFFCKWGWQKTEDAISLLMAFSAFKKRLQTGMKLLLAGTGPSEKIWQEKLRTYRYRNDVVIVSGLDTAKYFELMAAAYGVIHLPVQPEVSGLLQAMHSGVPAITHPHPCLVEVAEDAALYCTNAPGETLAQHLMQLYKDESLRKSLIEKGRNRADNYSASNVANRLQSAIEQI